MIQALWGQFYNVRLSLLLEPVLTEAEVKQIMNLIAEKRLAPGLETHFQHVNHVKDIKATKNPPI